MSDIIITAIAGSITTFVAGFTAWIFARRKNNAEVSKTESEAEVGELSVIEKAITIWRETANALTEEVKALRIANGELRTEVNALREENCNLHVEIGRLRKANNRILEALTKITSENAKQVVDELKEKLTDNG